MKTGYKLQNLHLLITKCKVVVGGLKILVNVCKWIEIKKDKFLEVLGKGFSGRQFIFLKFLHLKYLPSLFSLTRSE